ncbi:hypothetical protein [Butyrivibrio sp. TB]|uniref:hypothetical protein n=1 Tax=Butyrivibrio sp. TB TaxID=1520809 RepID=UPI0008C0E869|nr:hypothetical protein [Butyrivibrio sp. TB]SEP95137.1 hypothetical protein SAMN02910382_01519 [Butyrivibrio sp. TB]
MFSGIALEIKDINRHVERILIYSILSGMAIILVVLLSYEVYKNNHVVVRDISEFSIGDDSSITYEIENPFQLSDDGYYYVSGWFVQKDNMYEYYNYGADLHSEGPYNDMHFCLIENDSCYIIPTKLTRRDDVESVLEGKEKGYCGFFSRVKGDFDNDEIQYGMLTVNPEGAETLYVFKKQ